MPSAARQRLPADLWRQGQRKHSSTSPGLFYNSQDIQANPGQIDVIEEKLRQGNKSNHKSHKRQFNGRGSPRSLPRRGSSETLNMDLSDSDSSSSSAGVLSSSAKSEGFVSFIPASEVCDAYAMESSVAPHPSQLPFPPLEWLQSSPMRSSPPTIGGFSLKTILACHLAA
ncbi:uncharacterized protein LOC131943156 [Physella acuta]|uniref:uncharacterized protein LOC131943156 n=1 Tax=Physella acuta TaxID=109671 RepID=UPI0027DB233D|nr:uncharacterized protein LOC131943156 [Physella acuta]